MMEPLPPGPGVAVLVIPIPAVPPPVRGRPRLGDASALRLPGPLIEADVAWRACDKQTPGRLCFRPAVASRATDSGEQSRDELGAVGLHLRARHDDIEADLRRARRRRVICVAVERKRPNPLQLAARAHRVDERNAVDRIAADVDDEQFSALLACLPSIRLVGTYVDVVPGSLGRSHQLGGEL